MTLKPPAQLSSMNRQFARNGRRTKLMENMDVPNDGPPGVGIGLFSKNDDSLPSYSFIGLEK
jgi:hypothetical protein